MVMSGVIYFSFTTPPPQQVIGEASRVFYYHIPQAWVCVLAFLMAMIYSVKYLKTKNLNDDDKASEAARLGLIFCLLATITGSIFARVTWGSFWNWDPRETSVFILLLIYGAYFALRGAVADEEKKAALSAVYAIFAFITVPFLVFVIPRIIPSLHPEDSIVDDNMKFTMGPSVRMIFFTSLAVFTVIYLWLFRLGTRLGMIRRSLVKLED